MRSVGVTDPGCLLQKGEECCLVWASGVCANIKQGIEASIACPCISVFPGFGILSYSKQVI